jgi:hypothetical protein
MKHKVEDNSYQKAEAVLKMINNMDENHHPFDPIDLPKQTP